QSQTRLASRLRLVRPSVTDSPRLPAAARTTIGVDQPATGPAVHDAVGPQRAGRDQPAHRARHLLRPEPEQARQQSLVAEDRAAHIAVEQPLQRALAREPPALRDAPGKPRPP